MNKPIIAILGKPNVGKSTLFNRLVGKRQSIVSHIEGVTRDRIYGEFEWLSTEYSLIDTGGFIPKSKNVIDQQVNFQAEIAKEKSDLILFLVDGRSEITSSDRILADIIKKSNKPYILIINKIDTKKQENDIFQFFELGLGNPVCISAQEGRQTGLILDVIHENLSKKINKENHNQNVISLAIVGMPNVGKSSMMNNLLKEEKSIVTNVAGTTRDSVDSYMKYFDNSFRLIDTAGLRKKTKIEDALEFYSFVRTNRVIEECDIAAILIDANKGFHAQDKNIINYIIKKGKGLLIVVNKWDLIETDTMTMKNFSDDIIYEYPILANFPIVFVSVKNNLRVTKVMKIALEIFHNLNKKIKTNNLNIFLKKILNHYPPPSVKGKEINIKLLSQLNTKPPIFGFFTSNPSLIPESYKRYLANQIYKKFNFHGVPIKISFKQK